MTPRIRLGMVGGGQGAFIGAVHRIAARIDDRFDLVAGALSSDPARARASADEIGLPRSYGAYIEMAEAEAAREDGIQAVAIVTPNNLHAPVAEAFLRAGIHVICDKPLTATLDEAYVLAELVRQNDSLFVLTHNYTGYPMIRQARAMVAAGELGTLRLINAEYLQDWLAETPAPDQKQAAWRLDPEQAGAGALGDIGTHAHNLACFVAGQSVAQVAADVGSLVSGRIIDDNVHATLRFSGGARGTLWASQVAIGHENGLSLRIYGDKAGLRWHQEEPNKLWFTRLGQPPQLLTRSGSGAADVANRVSRVPAGHPEGYLEGFATIYSEAADAILATETGGTLPADHHVNGIEEGVAGMRFIAACLKSSKADGLWTAL
ncbi:Gfo/Idh/MocA family oxidoreductase [Gymnodinialimonas sp. 2305UL16-5]|uniref:Gfo/Idh/MocA family protein n=1 Tax=Gymnodinialimonas mytili TaxID=3126503 RepID=UPI00309BD74C